MTEILNISDSFGTLTITTTSGGALLAIDDALANPICSQILSPVQLAILLSVLGIPGGGSLTDTQLRDSPVEVADTNGQGSVRYITDTSVVTGLSAKQVVCLTDTVFATFTRTGATGSIVGLTLPAGTLLIGPVTAITLTSGAVAAYA